MNRFEVHSHTEFSNARLLDCINKPEKLINYAQKLGLSGIAITDHEILSSGVRVNKIAKELKDTGFKIALGNEIYLTDTRDKGQKYYHFILIAKDKIGYTLMKELSTTAWLNGYMDNMERVPTLKSEGQYNGLISAIDKAEEELTKIKLEIEKNSNELNRMVELIPIRDEQLNTIRESIAIAKDSYDRELEIKKQEVDKDYEEHVNAIQSNISNIISAYGKQCESLTETIHTYENYINSFIEAKKRALEQENNLEFYKLNLSEIDINDIEQLLKLSNSFSKPDILRKLVYKTYFEKSMNDLLGRVIGTNSEVSGVYKITHIDTKMCYIGQAVNLKERWRKHLKCGLGIDTPSTNAFYQAMIKYQPWNFTWEVLEYCPKEKLNEVEKHYIDFFQSKSWGWNSKGGNK